MVPLLSSVASEAPSKATKLKRVYRADSFRVRMLQPLNPGMTMHNVRRFVQHHKNTAKPNGNPEVHTLLCKP